MTTLETMKVKIEREAKVFIKISIFKCDGYEGYATVGTEKETIGKRFIAIKGDIEEFSVYGASSPSNAKKQVIALVANHYGIDVGDTEDDIKRANDAEFQVRIGINQ